jgi:chromosome segregation and condensation protein ScpB
VLEAALLAAREPMAPADMKKMFDEPLSSDTLRKLLDELREDWAERPVELVQLASGWRFRTRAEYPALPRPAESRKAAAIRGPCSKRWPSSPTASR